MYVCLYPLYGRLIVIDSCSRRFNERQQMKYGWRDDNKSYLIAFKTPTHFCVGYGKRTNVYNVRVSSLVRTRYTVLTAYNTVQR